MAAKVGALFVDMAMNTAAFASDLAKTQNALNSWATTSNKALGSVVNGYRGLSKEVGNFISRTLTLRNAMLTLAGGGAIGALIKSQLEYAGSLVDTADNIGITTKTLQEYIFVARQSGADTELVKDAFKRLSVNVGQVHQEMGKFYNYLQKSNPELAAQVQHAGSLDEVIQAVFHDMSKMTDQADRMELAFSAFGKSGVALVNMMRNGEDAMNAMRQKANELGIVIEDSLLRKAQAAGDKVDVLSQVLKARLLVAVAENADVINDFAGAVIEATPNVIEFTASIINLATWLVSTKGAAADLVSGFIILSGEAAKAGIKMADALLPMNRDLEKSKMLIEGIDAEVADRINRVREAANMLSGDKVSKEQFGPPVPVQMLNEANGAWEDYVSNMKDAADGARAGESEFKKLQAAAERIKQEGQGTFVTYVNDLKELDKMLKANLLTWEEYNNAVQNVRDKFNSRRTALLSDVRAAQEKYNQSMKEAEELRKMGILSEEEYADAVSKVSAELRKAQLEGSLFGDIMDKAIDGNIQSWKDLGRAVIDFGRILLKNLANGQGLGNAFGGGDGGIGGLIGGAGGLLGSLFGGGFSQSWGFLTSAPGTYGPFPSFHSGGIVGSGGRSRRVDPAVFANAPRFHNGGLVGDEVPIIAKRGERVLTEDQQANMGGTVVYNIDARGAEAGVETRLRQMILELHQSVEPRAVRAVQNARARDPLLFNEGIA